MAQDEEATLRRLHEYRKVFNDIVTRHGGAVFGVAGDSEMAVFAEAGGAVQCALQLQEAVGRRNSVLPKASRMPIRVGLNFGPVIAEGQDVYGDEVNLTARVENFAEAGEVCVSGAVFDRVRGQLEVGFDSFGKQRFKNIDRPVRVYRVRTDPQAVGQVIPTKRRRPQPGRYWRFAAVVCLIALLGATIWGIGVHIEKQNAALAAEKLIVETRQSVGEAQDQIERLLGRLQHVSDKSAGDGERIDALIALLQQAQEVAENQEHLSRRRSAEIRRLLELLEASENRAAAERARADELLHALQEAEQTTEAQSLREWEESFGTAVMGQIGERPLRETLLSSWREAEQQAALSQSRAEQLLATVNKLEAFALVDQSAVVKDSVLRGETVAQVSGERERAEALLDSLREARALAIGKREQAEDLHARLLQAEAIVSENSTALHTLQGETSKIEELLAALQALEARITDDVAGAERAMQTLIDAESAAKLQREIPGRPLPTDRSGASHITDQKRAEGFLAAIVRAAHDSRTMQQRQLKSQSKLSLSSPSNSERPIPYNLVLGPLQQKLAPLSETPPATSVESARDVSTLATASTPLTRQQRNGTSGSGSYDGTWLLRLVQGGDTGAQFEADLDVRNNTFIAKTSAHGWNIGLIGVIDEATGRLTASGTIRTLARAIYEIVRIEANFVDGAYSTEVLPSAKWRPPEPLLFNLVPKKLSGNRGEIATNSSSSVLGPVPNLVRDFNSGIYDGVWNLQIRLVDYVEGHLEIPVEVNNGAFLSNAVSRGWRIYLAGLIDDETGQLTANGQIWRNDWSTFYRRSRGDFKIEANLVEGAFSGSPRVTAGRWTELPENLQFTLAPSKQVAEKLAELTNVSMTDVRQALGTALNSGTYDGAWNLQIHLTGSVERQFEIPIDMNKSTFISHAVSRGWRTYLSGAIDDATGQLEATGQIWSNDWATSYPGVRGTFKFEANLVEGAFSGSVRVSNSLLRSELPLYLKFTLAPSKQVAEKLAELTNVNMTDVAQAIGTDLNSGNYDGPWVVRFLLDDGNYRQAAYETELDIKSNAFINQTASTGWRVYFAGQIDETSGRLIATGQIRDNFSDCCKIKGVFKIEADLVEEAYSGSVRINNGTRMGLPEHVKYTIVRKEVSEQFTAK